MHPRIGFVLICSLAFVSCSDSTTDFTGFWKGDCTDAFGIQIKPHSGKDYSVSFCGPGGCFEPGAWKPNTPIEGDPAYRVIDAKTIEIMQGERWQRFTKCMTDTNPVLDYSTMPDQPRGSEVKFFDPNQGLPDYEKNSPFVGSDPRLHESLNRLLSSASAASRYCKVGATPAPGIGDQPLLSNLCRRPEFEELRSLVSRLAPSLDKNRLTLWKADLHAPGRNGLIVGYIDISQEKDFPYPYLSLWYLDSDKGRFRATYGGSYLAGELHAIRQFGPGGSQKRVFVLYQSCLECHPWIFMSVLDFAASGQASHFRFTYDADHKKFSNSFEYDLPGMGHSVDAAAETRIPKAADPNGPHLFQHFRYKNEAKEEWWVFTCQGLKCDHEMYLKELPTKYRQAWNNSEKL